jgi:carbon monoxide dehydrogenase subunit G
MGVAHIKGKYKGKIVIADAEPPSTYRLQIEGKGAPGFVSASVRINLRSEESGTHLTYAGEAQVGGLIAGVGQRIRGGVAKLTLEQFFKGIERGAG